MAAASGGLLFINGLGAMSGPIVVGYAMAELGNQWFFIAIVLGLMATICVYGIYRITQRTYDIAPEDAAPHVLLTSRTTAVGAEFAIEAADEAHARLTSKRLTRPVSGIATIMMCKAYESFSDEHDRTR